MAIKRIGQVMIDHGFITPEQLDILLEKQKEHRHELLGQLAISMGLITDEQLVEVLADHLNVPAYNLADGRRLQDYSSQSGKQRSDRRHGSAAAASGH